MGEIGPDSSQFEWVATVKANAKPATTGDGDHWIYVLINIGDKQFSGSPLSHIVPLLTVGWLAFHRCAPRMNDWMNINNTRKINGNCSFGTMANDTKKNMFLLYKI